MTPIQDHEAYSARLTHTLEEKLFFLDHITDASIFVDFGCGDGKLLDAVAKRLARPIVTVGHDEDPRYETVSEWWAVVQTTSSLHQHFIPTEGLHKTVLIFSSVLHEVFTKYSGLSAISRAQWVLDMARGVDADYIVVRDMAVPGHVDPEWARALEDFLKEPWRNGPDWEREEAETYLSVPSDLGLLISSVSRGDWRVRYERRYIPLAVSDRWPKGLPKTTTHFQLILERSR